GIGCAAGPPPLADGYPVVELVCPLALSLWRRRWVGMVAMALAQRGRAAHRAGRLGAAIPAVAQVLSPGRLRYSSRSAVMARARTDIWSAVACPRFSMRQSPIYTARDWDRQ